MHVGNIQRRTDIRVNRKSCRIKHLYFEEKTKGQVKKSRQARLDMKPFRSSHEYHLESVLHWSLQQSRRKKTDLKGQTVVAKGTGS